MKRFLSHINWILGSLSLLLAGCGSQKHAVKNHEVMVLYGVGLEDYAPIPETAIPELSDDANTDKSGTNSDAKKGVKSDSIPEDSRTIALPTDSLNQGLTPRGDRPSIMVKYGVMPPKQPSSN